MLAMFPLFGFKVMVFTSKRAGLIYSTWSIVESLKAMAGRSHEPYYFSAKWNINGPNIPSFLGSIISIVSEAN
jgi:hypothetical protein